MRLQACQTSSRPCSSSQETPLLTAVKERGRKLYEVPFHVPGHKRGMGASDGMVEIMGKQALRHDLTEIPGLDYLSAPTGVIDQAQSLAAKTFGSTKTWFLVNGCTVGLQAAVLATSHPGATVVVARNCHSSVFSGLVLAGCFPLYVQPEYDATNSIVHGIIARDLHTTLDSAASEGRRVGAVVVVSPTYYGSICDIEALANVCHSHGVPLIVDEAHGAHLHFHQDCPSPALACGADIVVHSTHKMMSSLTQSAMLHLRGCRVDSVKISKALQLLQSSSPSYLLLSSLDAARKQADQDAAYEEPLHAARLAADGLSKLKGLSVVCPAVPKLCSVHAFDPLRVVVNVESWGTTGYSVGEWLEQKAGIVAEFATEKLVVLVMGPGTNAGHGKALIKAMASCNAAIGEESSPDVNKAPLAGPLTSIETVLSPREAFFADTETVCLSDALGRVCGEAVCPYPPGIPLVYPGELLSSENLALLADIQRSEAKISGVEDPSLSTLRVIVT